MRSSLTFVVAALVAFAAAAPATSAEEPGVSKRDCVFGGKCNGTSCRIGLINYGCSSGSCVGPGGGDGARCCATGTLAQGPYACPGGDF